MTRGIKIINNSNGFFPMLSSSVSFFFRFDSKGEYCCVFTLSPEIDVVNGLLVVVVVTVVTVFCCVQCEPI